MQRLEVRGFLGLRNVSIEFNAITALIGEQAAGKSIIARLVYFFNEYMAGFDEIALSRNEHKSAYDKRKRAEFFGYFAFCVGGLGSCHASTPPDVVR